MKHLLNVAVALFLTNSSCAATKISDHTSKLIRVAILDTGKPWTTEAPVCPTGHKDYSGMGINDTHGHASHVSDVIDQNVKGRPRTSYSNDFDDNSVYNEGVGYCLIFFKYYNKNAAGDQNLLASNLAIEEATRQKVDVIVYAGGGAAYDRREASAIKAALNAGIVVIAAAGNEARDTATKPYYPAQYDDRVQSVGNLRRDDSPIILEDKCSTDIRKKLNSKTVKCQPSSNFGDSVKYWEVGTNVVGKINGIPTYMTGTSQATAIRAGKVIRELIEGLK